MPKDLDDLKKKLDDLAPKKTKPQEGSSSPLNAGIEMVSGVMVGVGLGLLFDWFFGTSPFGLIVLFLAGSAAGMLNVFRVLNKKDKDDK